MSGASTACRRPGTILAGLLLVAAAVGAAQAPLGLEEAIRAQQSYLEEHPSDLRALNDLANLLVLDRRWEEAEALYREALLTASQHVPSRFNLALLLQRRGRLTEALEEYDRLLAQDPLHGWAWYQSGVVLSRLGERKGALERFIAAFDADPELENPRVNPHVIQNRLATEASLRVYLARSASGTAPMSFQEPERIRNLLMPAVAESEEEEGLDEAEGEASEDRVLGQQSLEGGNRGQVRGGGADGGYSGVRPAPPRRPVRRSTPQDPEQLEEPEEEEPGELEEPPFEDFDDWEDEDEWSEAEPSDDEVHDEYDEPPG